jgi:hypothetical protein
MDFWYTIVARGGSIRYSHNKHEPLSKAFPRQAGLVWLAGCSAFCTVIFADLHALWAGVYARKADISVPNGPIIDKNISKRAARLARLHTPPGAYQLSAAFLHNTPSLTPHSCQSSSMYAHIIILPLPSLFLCSFCNANNCSPERERGPECIVCIYSSNNQITHTHPPYTPNPKYGPFFSSYLYAVS